MRITITGPENTVKNSISKRFSKKREKQTCLRESQADLSQGTSRHTPRPYFRHILVSGTYWGRGSEAGMGSPTTSLSGVSQKPPEGLETEKQEDNDLCKRNF